MGPESAIELEILRLAERQHGVVARRQLLALGLGAEAIKHRAGSGRLVRLGRGVYALGHREPRPEARWVAAVLRCGPDAVLSHRSAGALWTLRPWTGSRVEVTVRSHRGRHPDADLLVRRSLDLADWEVTVERGIPVTSPARTLLDLAAVVRPHQLRRAVERSEQLELFDLRRVRRTLDAHPHRPGAPALIALLADMGLHGETRTRSDSEALFLELCLAHGLPRPEVNRFGTAGEVDFRWPAQRVVVELNSPTFHATRDGYERDHDKRLALERAGWRVVSFTLRQLHRSPEVVVADLRRVLGGPDGR